MSVAAVLWSVALFAVALTAPVYEVQTSGGQDSLTLVQENGVGALIPLACVLVVTVSVGFALRKRCTTGRHSATVAAWVLTVLLVAFSLAAAASIGLLVAPAALLELGAVMTTPLPAPSART